MDKDRTVTNGLAIKDGRILALGGDVDIAGLGDEHTKRIDLGGRTAIPGIFDSHAHLQEVGVKLAAIRLDECESPEEMMELVREKAKDVPAGTWIVGMGWNEGNFKDGRLPTKHDIDPATDKHPVILQRFFNADVVNSVALTLAGISRATPDPDGGKIERDAAGEPTGLIRAAAKMLVRPLVPVPTAAELENAVRLGCHEFNSFGITSVVDPGLMADQMAAFQQVYLDGDLTVRMNLMPSWHGFREQESEAQLEYRARELGLFTGIGDDWLKLGGLKMAIDGGTTPHTAYMYEPFEGESEVVNYNRLDTEDLRRYFTSAQEMHWDVGIHVTGDRAMDMCVEAFAEVTGKVSWPDARHNIIHAYFPSDRGLELMAKHNIAAVIQPTFMYWEGDLIFRDVGHARAANWKPARKFLEHGIVLTSSSDVPSTVSTNPFVALYALITRRNNLNQLVAPDQALTRDEALYSYTMAGPWLTREESLKGSLELGKVADIAILDRDYFSIPEDEIKEIQVDTTIAGGEVVWSRI
eukprot:jgi/Undpi1/11772/HiC_scaffold_39.g14067.m1